MQVPTIFPCNVGVRHGENRSPILFFIFLNDLTEFISHAYEGLNRISNMAHLLHSDDDVEVYFKLHADDTEKEHELQAALTLTENFMYYSMRTIAENEHELQAALNAMLSYFKYWDLEVNPSKTKITFLATRSFITPHHLSTMVIISRSMIVLYTRELYFPATFFSSQK